MPSPLAGAAQRDHGERLAAVETLLNAQRDDIHALRGDVHGIYERLDSIAQSVARACDALHTPLTCPNAGRIAALESEATEQRGARKVVVWLVGIVAGLAATLAAKVFEWMGAGGK